MKCDSPLLEVSLEHNFEMMISWNIESLLAPEFFFPQVNALWGGSSSYMYKRYQPALCRTCERLTDVKKSQKCSFHYFYVFIILLSALGKEGACAQRACPLDPPLYVIDGWAIKKDKIIDIVCDAFTTVESRR